VFADPPIRVCPVLREKGLLFAGIDVIGEALDELRQTEAALARLEGGEYGVCAVCGNPIEPERLELIPEAVRCAKHA